MRVLHIDTGREMRGGQYQMLLLVEGLRREGVSQTVVSQMAVSQMIAANAARGAQDVRTVRPASWRAVRRAARQSDVIHAHDAHAHTLAVVHGGGKPVVVSRRVAFPIQTGLLSRWKYARAAHYLAVSRFVAAELAAAGVAADRISVVRDAVKPAASARPETPADRPFRVLTHGLTDPGKGGALAAAACRAAGLTPSIAADLPADLREADVFLYLSESEGLGSAILLAMAAGVPVIASNVGGIPELIRHEQTGLLVENDAASAAAALRRLRADPALRRRLAGAARRGALEEFSHTGMVRETLAIYRRVLGLPPGSP